MIVDASAGAVIAAVGATLASTEQFGFANEPERVPLKQFLDSETLEQRLPNGTVDAL